jgi:hypothetical protein
VDDAILGPDRLKGAISSGKHSIAWELAFRGDMQPLFLLPLRFYQTGFPKAKMLVGLPMAIYDGTLSVDGKKVEVTNWVGSQNHNWGSKHTDLYAWGQVAGFDSHPDSLLEVGTARLKMGPIWTPPMTLLVLRHKGKEIALNSLMQAVRAKGSFKYFVWDFTSETDEIRIEGTISARNKHFVVLKYYNPQGGIKHCLNTKIASCQLKVTHKQAGKPTATETLSTKNRAAFEILTDKRDHGVEIRA